MNVSKYNSTYLDYHERIDINKRFNFIDNEITTYKDYLIMFLSHIDQLNDELLYSLCYATMRDLKRGYNKEDSLKILNCFNEFRDVEICDIDLLYIITVGEGNYVIMQDGNPHIIKSNDEILYHL